MIDPRNILFRQHDVVEHTMMAELQRGPIFRTVRLVKQGPLCPSVIMWLHTLYEPGEPSNSMDRSPFIAAYLSGELFDGPPARLYTMGRAGTEHISRAEYMRAVAEISSNRRANRFDPRCFPFDPVAVDQIPLPFLEEAHAQRHRAARRPRS